MANDLRNMTAVLEAEERPKAERLATRKAFLADRAEIWNDIREGRFPATYVSADGKKYTGAPRRTAIRCDFLLANKLALGPQCRTDSIADEAQRDLLFHVLRDRERFPERTGDKFYCCPRCTAKLRECVSAKVFRYVDNEKWRAAIEGRRKTVTRAGARR